MPAFINRSWPLLLMPLWWVFWLLGLVFHSCHFVFRNRYRHIKARRREEAKEAETTATAKVATFEEEAAPHE